MEGSINTTTVQRERERAHEAVQQVCHPRGTTLHKELASRFLAHHCTPQPPQHLRLQPPHNGSGTQGPAAPTLQQSST